MSGFVGGDGGFSIYVRSVNDYALNPSTQGQDPGSGPRGEKVYCRFHIAQHSKDLELMQMFVQFFGCGKVEVRSNIRTPLSQSPKGGYRRSPWARPKGRCDFIIQDTSFLLEKVVGHFDLYPLFNLKHEDYLCFKQALLLVKEKKHLTIEGLKKIKSLNLEMNSNRLG